MTLEPVSALSPGTGRAERAPGSPAPKPTPAEITRASQQFEAIMVRQLLGPSIEPIMKGGGSDEGAGGGGGTYAYMLTDMLADNITKGGGLGLSGVISRQFQPAPPVARAR
jgi:flagellar protein FlgJ